MTKHDFFWVDAFTSIPYEGNPCAVIFDTDDFSDADRLTIAKEMNLSETAFVFKSSKADFGARYFTPAGEIPLAGHPTIATIHSLLELGLIIPDSNSHVVTLELKAGVIPIEILVNSDKSHKIIMSQNRPQFLSIHDTMTVAPLFNLTPDDILHDQPIQTVSTGTPQLMIPVKNKMSLKKLALNHERYQPYREHSDFESAHLFCLEGISPIGNTFARHPGVPPEIAEDSFTGSATGGMAAYLWKYGLIKNPKFIAEQGHWMGRPGSAEAEVIGPANNIETVKVGGHAVTVFRGKVELRRA